MSLYLKKVAESKLFVPIIIFIMVLIALSSLNSTKSSRTAVISPEKQLEELCNAVEGVKNAKVMITYQNSESISVFESNQTSKIQGIAVICEGGKNPNVQLKLHELLKALFGISSTQITVSEINSSFLS